VISRRKLLKMAAEAAAAHQFGSLTTLRTLNSKVQTPNSLVPADKGLSPKWINGLRERGTPTVYSGEALEHIGMPIGGIGCGQVYLSGDGRLWHWDIFNQLGESDMAGVTNGLHYKEPMKVVSPFQIAFGAEIAPNELLPLDSSQFRTEFMGRYPIGEVKYTDGNGMRPFEITLEAFSPFIPLNADDSGLPVAILTYTIKNNSGAPLAMAIGGALENPACFQSRSRRPVRLNDGHGTNYIHFSASDQPSPRPSPRPDIVFEDFEKPIYEGWRVEGTAFGPGPIEIAKIPKYQGDVRGIGKRVANSHNVRAGEDVAGGDAHIGTLTSREFLIERHFITFLIGGGNDPGKTGMLLFVDGVLIERATGHDSNAMREWAWDVRGYEGKNARIEIIDIIGGPWGNVGIDQIVFTDLPAQSAAHLEEEADYGTFAVGLLTPAKSEFPFEEFIGTRVEMKAGESKQVTFVVAWHFPNVNRQQLGSLERHDSFKRHYASRFKDAIEVFQYVEKNFERLNHETRLWTRTWYDSTLPYWFLDRTMANTSTLSTSTCYRFDDGRFYGWEGVYCCPGTCTHVWHYAQAVARLFPELERDTRERVDYGIAYHPDGALGHRAEAWQDPATDGQCGTILRVYREHQMSVDDAFLKRIWPRVKKSVEYLIAQDPNLDGVLEGAQFNTLDATWYGKIAWISSLYVAALRAGEAMANEMNDPEFAKKCGAIATAGSKHISTELWNGEYFIQKVDPRFPKAINTNDGCHIDQVFGQSWAHQLGLPRVLPEEKTRTALHSLYRYNYAPDVGTYRSAMKDIGGGRWYALPGEPGLLMCTWPKGGASKAAGEGQANWAVGYFNECMSGFEHQVAGHMMREGLVDEGLIVERAIHDRYKASKRNPYNEIECSDHYARAMASYGVFLAACGFNCHGPHGRLSFDPKISPENFKAAFTCATGWGSYSQKIVGDRMTCEIAVQHGRVRLQELELGLAAGWHAAKVDDKFSAKQEGRMLLLTPKKPINLVADETLSVRVVRNL
jgi:non-lysosomal glucosylceramidase